uniref:Uncharacterized protein n=1 Tax=Arundo donax TaxID=35708 RepID=A0A0A8XPW4_ARUDO
MAWPAARRWCGAQALAARWTAWSVARRSCGAQAHAAHWTAWPAARRSDGVQARMARWTAWTSSPARVREATTVRGAAGWHGCRAGPQEQRLPQPHHARVECEHDRASWAAATVKNVADMDLFRLRPLHLHRQPMIKEQWRRLWTPQITHQPCSRTPPTCLTKYQVQTAVSEV